jgi:phospholipid/cholesterol/gamma-HCH transport system permease protein
MNFQIKKNNSDFKIFFFKIFIAICYIGKLNISFLKNIFLYIKNKILIFFFNLIIGPFYINEILSQISSIGFGSIPIISLTGIFTGSVLALQIYMGFSQINNIESIPLIVLVSITRELGPVLTGLMLSGRIASSISSEIGSMKISDQINAMKIMSISDIKYLFRPRLIAILIFMPILTFIADILAIIGGFFVSITKLNFNPSLYIKLTCDFFNINDFLSGIYKSFIFGIIIVSVGYLFGILNSNSSAASVSNSTKNSVVVATILILFSNYILTYFLFS